MLNLAQSTSAELSIITSATGVVEVATSYVDFVAGVATCRVTTSSTPARILERSASIVVADR